MVDLSRNIADLERSSLHFYDETRCAIARRFDKRNSLSRSRRLILKKGGCVDRPLDVYFLHLVIKKLEISHLFLTRALFILRIFALPRGEWLIVPG